LLLTYCNFILSKHHHYQRIISESFDSRGSQKFIDVAGPGPAERALYLPAIMLRAEGKIVCDPKISEVFIYMYKYVLYDYMYICF
jgi:hypothetical protein